LDDEYDCVPLGGRNKDKPDGNKKAKEKLKKLVDASSLSGKIDVIVKSKEVLVNKILETNLYLAKM
jgi:hypothetical protein